MAKLSIRWTLSSKQDGYNVKAKVRKYWKRMPLTQQKEEKRTVGIEWSWKEKQRGKGYAQQWKARKGKKSKTWKIIWAGAATSMAIPISDS
jgi:hypothetical protein